MLCSREVKSGSKAGVFPSISFMQSWITPTMVERSLWGRRTIDAIEARRINEFISKGEFSSWPGIEAVLVTMFDSEFHEVS
ncbi:hypothetical protein L249_7278 [Ophiocordyceps polyrhachis-furcata BCC 54312]|uniref:Uncharacterized protein n=1 Tax=Ophiocordyceps polyrhachis-furcata BCC 54312 TaxID=1330021 RepID=A0A367LBK7_9HYPO|nr:hypothetical protein L249_7278 [Ophiocordyceps polyrhachis-furcata BCC 54312]